MCQEGSLLVEEFQTPGTDIAIAIPCYMQTMFTGKDGQEQGDLVSVFWAQKTKQGWSP